MDQQISQCMSFRPFNMQRDKVVVVRPGDQPWQNTPQNPFIQRWPLERELPESGQVTSLVRYAAGAKFPPHVHPNGEEIFVLEGTFSDESGDYPAGSYLRHAPGSQHSPFSENGCLIFVKLNQFAEDDNQTVRLTPAAQTWYPGQGNLTVCPLHEFQGQHTALVHWPAGEKFVPHQHWGGEEILVLKGCFKDEHGDYPQHTWLRSPHLSRHHPFVDEETLILVKVGHL